MCSYCLGVWHTRLYSCSVGSDSRFCLCCHGENVCSTSNSRGKRWGLVQPWQIFFILGLSRIVQVDVTTIPPLRAGERSPSARTTGAEECAPGGIHGRGTWTLACLLITVDVVCYLLHQREVRKRGGQEQKIRTLGHYSKYTTWYVFFPFVFRSLRSHNFRR